MPHETPARLSARPGRRLRGETRAPGDKSISHRALILGAMATGVTEISGLLEGDDVRRTAAAMAAFGASVERLGDGAWQVTGSGGLTAPGDVIDCGNAGTGARLMMGAAAGYDFTTTFTGDASLRSRPMARVLDPLSGMGAAWLGRVGARLPITLRGGGLRAVDYRLPMPSAQVKSAILLAGLNASGTTRVVEPEATRDHTERMLRAFGAEVGVSDEREGRVITLAGGQTLSGCAVEVPGDPSSAAFPLVAALITPGSEVTVRGVLLNPLRTGLFTTLREMGADLEITNVRASGGDDIGDITARFSSLLGVTVPPERAVSMIDEYPILSVAAAFARGPTIMSGLGELRVKESDRLALMAAGLAACGVSVDEEAEGLTVMGVDGANHPVRGGAAISTLGDHRIAMSFLILGLAARETVSVDEAGMIATSFPGFEALMAGLGADIAAD
jgi:3-phosphoshikimate 1-carboxyvinyltransferase